MCFHTRYSHIILNPRFSLPLSIDVTFTSNIGSNHLYIPHQRRTDIALEFSDHGSVWYHQSPPSAERWINRLESNCLWGYRGIYRLQQELSPTANGGRASAIWLKRENNIRIKKPEQIKAHGSPSPVIPGTVIPYCFYPLRLISFCKESRPIGKLDVRERPATLFAPFSVRCRSVFSFYAVWIVTFTPFP